MAFRAIPGKVIRNALFALGVMVLLAAGAGEARAHGFNIAFVAPLSGPAAHQGRQALDGFLLATRERDGHAFEEADGHLGGLDSYVIRIDSGRGLEAVRGQLGDLIRDGGVFFLTGVSVSETLAATGVVLDPGQAILIDAADSPVYRSAAKAPESLVTKDKVPFSAAFRDANGSDADANAVTGYIAARFIDAAVSAVQGDFSRREAMDRALEHARQHLP